MASPTETQVARRTQADRSAATRARLLDATLASLVEDGYVGTTTTAVAQRAGVSRGAQLHHYGTKEKLVAAAVGHLAEQRAAVLRAEVAKLANEENKVRRTLDLLADLLSGPLYAATIELWVAARSDPALRELLIPVEARLAIDLREICRENLTSDPLLQQMTLDLLLGRGVSGLLTDFTASQRSRALDAWAEMLATRNSPPTK
ncbi:TetR/AcrR family transcriptional regulator [Cryptosporangium aurantiacum]|uniref:Transcriptional regulator, TetR family n=1 Tax=Cryptosporangium aurantiacum TaxID=134849 RepID=A0A1M7MPZ8_9ACTN|nr:TetR/AcrR family transcriptional regulator [Cryptosporangium aurantiacum]SHM93059.1 transcriptional regulator, TetR family [Cryptosporangium aurantiacum]